MIKLIIIIVIGIIISQITTAIKKKQEEARRGGQGIPKLEVDLDYLEEKRVKVNEQPTLRMETREKPIIRTLESEKDDEEAFDEKQGSPYKTKAKPQVTPKLEASTKKPPIVSFAPKSILQGIVISEILKRPRY